LHCIERRTVSTFKTEIAFTARYPSSKILVSSYDNGGVPPALLSPRRERAPNSDLRMIKSELIGKRLLMFSKDKPPWSYILMVAFLSSTLWIISLTLAKEIASPSRRVTFNSDEMKFHPGIVIPHQLHHHEVMEVPLVNRCENTRPTRPIEYICKYFTCE